MIAIAATMTLALLSQVPRPAPAMSPERRAALQSTLERQRESQRRTHAAAMRRRTLIAQQEAWAAACQAAWEQEMIRRNTPNYISITTDRAGRVTNVYASYPGGMSISQSASGSYSVSQSR